jgi:hypothetical protein
MNTTIMALIIGAVAAIAVAAAIMASHFKPGTEHAARSPHSCGHCGSGTGATCETKPSVAAGDYPLGVCVVSGEALGSMGAPYTFVHHGTEVKLCCRSCLNEFHREADMLLERIRAAANQPG